MSEKRMIKIYQVPYYYFKDGKLQDNAKLWPYYGGSALGDFASDYDTKVVDKSKRSVYTHKTPDTIQDFYIQVKDRDNNVMHTMPHKGHANRRGFSGLGYLSKIKEPLLPIDNRLSAYSVFDVPSADYYPEGAPDDVIRKQLINNIEFYMQNVFAEDLERTKDINLQDLQSLSTKELDELHLDLQLYFLLTQDGNPVNPFAIREYLQNNENYNEEERPRDENLYMYNVPLIATMNEDDIRTATQLIDMHGDLLRMPNEEQTKVIKSQDYPYIDLYTVNPKYDPDYIKWIDSMSLLDAQKEVANDRQGHLDKITPIKINKGDTPHSINLIKHFTYGGNTVSDALYKQIVMDMSNKRKHENIVNAVNRRY